MGIDSDKMRQQLKQVLARPVLAPLDGVEVELTVDIGSKNLSLAEIANLRTDDTVVMDQLTSDPAVLRANGAAVARGQLMQDQNGELAFRVDETSDQHSL